MVIQLREEAQKLKNEYTNLQGKVAELKVWILPLSMIWIWCFLFDCQLEYSPILPFDKIMNIPAV